MDLKKLTERLSEGGQRLSIGGKRFSQIVSQTVSENGKVVRSQMSQTMTSTKMGKVVVSQTDDPQGRKNAQDILLGKKNDQEPGRDRSSTESSVGRDHLQPSKTDRSSRENSVGRDHLQPSKTDRSSTENSVGRDHLQPSKTDRDQRGNETAKHYRISHSNQSDRTDRLQKNCQCDHREDDQRQTSDHRQNDQRQSNNHTVRADPLNDSRDSEQEQLSLHDQKNESISTVRNGLGTFTTRSKAKDLSMSEHMSGDKRTKMNGSSVSGDTASLVQRGSSGLSRGKSSSTTIQHALRQPVQQRSAGEKPSSSSNEVGKQFGENERTKQLVSYKKHFSVVSDESRSYEEDESRIESEEEEVFDGSYNYRRFGATVAICCESKLLLFSLFLNFLAAVVSTVGSVYLTTLALTDGRIINQAGLLRLKTQSAVHAITQLAHFYSGTTNSNSSNTTSSGILIISPNNSTTTNNSATGNVVVGNAAGNAAGNADNRSNTSATSSSGNNADTTVDLDELLNFPFPGPGVYLDAHWEEHHLGFDSTLLAISACKSWKDYKRLREIYSSLMNQMFIDMGSYADSNRVNMSNRRTPNEETSNEGNSRLSTSSTSSVIGNRNLASVSFLKAKLHQVDVEIRKALARVVVEIHRDLVVSVDAVCEVQVGSFGEGCPEIEDWKRDRLKPFEYAVYIFAQSIDPEFEITDAQHNAIRDVMNKYIHLHHYRFADFVVPKWRFGAIPTRPSFQAGTTSSDRGGNSRNVDATDSGSSTDENTSGRMLAYDNGFPLESIAMGGTAMESALKKADHPLKIRRTHSNSENGSPPRRTQSDGCANSCDSGRSYLHYVFCPEDMFTNLLDNSYLSKLMKDAHDKNSASHCASMFIASRENLLGRFGKLAIIDMDRIVYNREIESHERQEWLLWLVVGRAFVSVMVAFFAFYAFRKVFDDATRLMEKLSDSKMERRNLKRINRFLDRKRMRLEIETSQAKDRVKRMEEDYREDSGKAEILRREVADKQLVVRELIAEQYSLIAEKTRLFKQSEKLTEQVELLEREGVENVRELMSIQRNSRFLQNPIPISGSAAPNRCKARPASSSFYQPGSGGKGYYSSQNYSDFSSNPYDRNGDFRNRSRNLDRNHDSSNNRNIIRQHHDSSNRHRRFHYGIHSDYYNYNYYDRDEGYAYRSDAYYLNEDYYHSGDRIGTNRIQRRRRSPSDRGTPARPPSEHDPRDDSQNTDSDSRDKDSDPRNKPPFDNFPRNSTTAAHMTSTPLYNSRLEENLTTLSAAPDINNSDTQHDLRGNTKNENIPNNARNKIIPGNDNSGSDNKYVDPTCRNPNAGNSRVLRDNFVNVDLRAHREQEVFNLNDLAAALRSRTPSLGRTIASESLSGTGLQKGSKCLTQGLLRDAKGVGDTERAKHQGIQEQLRLPLLLGNASHDLRQGNSLQGNNMQGDNALNCALVNRPVVPPLGRVSHPPPQPAAGPDPGTGKSTNTEKRQREDHQRQNQVHCGSQLSPENHLPPENFPENRDLVPILVPMPSQCDRSGDVHYVLLRDGLKGTQPTHLLRRQNPDVEGNFGPVHGANGIGSNGNSASSYENRNNAVLKNLPKAVYYIGGLAGRKFLTRHQLVMCDRYMLDIKHQFDEGHINQGNQNAAGQNPKGIVQDKSKCFVQPALHGSNNRLDEDSHYSKESEELIEIWAHETQEDWIAARIEEAKIRVWIIIDAVRHFTLHPSSYGLVAENGRPFIDFGKPSGFLKGNPGGNPQRIVRMTDDEITEEIEELHKIRHHLAQKLYGQKVLNFVLREIEFRSISNAQLEALKDFQRQSLATIVDELFGRNDLSIEQFPKSSEQFGTREVPLILPLEQEPATIDVREQEAATDVLGQEPAMVGLIAREQEPANQHEATPVVRKSPPAPATGQTFSPVVNEQQPDPVTEERTALVTEKSPVTVTEHQPDPVTEEQPDPVTEEQPDPVTEDHIGEFHFESMQSVFAALSSPVVIDNVAVQNPVVREPKPVPENQSHNMDEEFPKLQGEHSSSSSVSRVLERANDVVVGLAGDDTLEGLAGDDALEKVRLEAVYEKKEGEHKAFFDNNFDNNLVVHSDGQHNALSDGGEGQNQEGKENFFLRNLVCDVIDFLPIEYEISFRRINWVSKFFSGDTTDIFMREIIQRKITDRNYIPTDIEKIHCLCGCLTAARKPYSGIHSSGSSSPDRSSDNQSPDRCPTSGDPGNQKGPGDRPASSESGLPSGTSSSKQEDIQASASQKQLAKENELTTQEFSIGSQKTNSQKDADVQTVNKKDKDLQEDSAGQFNLRQANSENEPDLPKTIISESDLPKREADTRREDLQRTTGRNEGDLQTTTRRRENNSMQKTRNFKEESETGTPRDVVTDKPEFVMGPEWSKSLRNDLISLGISLAELGTVRLSFTGLRDRCRWDLFDMFLEVNDSGDEGGIIWEFIKQFASTQQDTLEAESIISLSHTEEEFGEREVAGEADRVGRSR